MSKKVPPVAEDNIAPQQEHIAVTPQDKTQPHKSNKPTQQFAYPHYDDEEAEAHCGAQAHPAAIVL